MGTSVRAQAYLDCANTIAIHVIARYPTQTFQQFYKFNTSDVINPKIIWELGSRKLLDLKGLNKIGSHLQSNF
jgi:hypothetical protein